MATTAIIAGVLGAGGAIGGGLLSQPDSIGSGDLEAFGFNPNANQLLNSSTLGLLGLIGGPTAGIAQQSSPLARLQNLPGTGSLGFSKRDAARLNNALAFISPIIEKGAEFGLPADVIEAAAVNFQALARQGSRPPTTELGIVRLAKNRAVSKEELREARGQPTIEGEARALSLLKTSGRPISNSDADKRAQLLQRAITAAGFGSIGELVGEQVKFTTQAAEQVRVQEETQPQVLAGIQSALGKISDLQQNFPIPTLDQIESFRTALTDRQSAEFLERANVAGINPSAGLGQVQNDPQNLANALQLFGGFQNIGAQALTTLQQSLLGPLGAATNAGQVQGNLSLGSAQLAQDQSLALAQLAAQQNSAGNVGLGNAVAGGANSLANIFGNLGASRQQTQQNEFLSNLFGSGGNTGTPGVLQGQELSNFQLPPGVGFGN